MITHWYVGCRQCTSWLAGMTSAHVSANATHLSLSCWSPMTYTNTDTTDVHDKIYDSQATSNVWNARRSVINAHEQLMHHSLYVMSHTFTSCDCGDYCHACHRSILLHALQKLTSSRSAPSFPTCDSQRNSHLTYDVSSRCIGGNLEVCQPQGDDRLTLLFYTSV